MESSTHRVIVSETFHSESNTTTSTPSSNVIPILVRIRLSKYLKDHPSFNKYLTSKTHIRQSIESHTILVNNEPTEPSRILKSGDIITLLEQNSQNEFHRKRHIVPDVKVIYEDALFAVVFKPAGVPVVPHHSLCSSMFMEEQNRNNIIPSIPTVFSSLPYVLSSSSKEFQFQP